jgi:hypothetical protein
VWARKIKLERIGTSLTCKLGQLLPVALVEAAHDTGNDNLGGVVLFEFANALAPVCGSLLGNELNVQERRLAWTEQMTSRRTARNPSHPPVRQLAIAKASDGSERRVSLLSIPDDTRRNVGDQILVERKGLGDSKAPTGIERSVDHFGRCAWRGAGETEWIGEVDAADIDRQIDQVNVGKELGQLWHLGHRQAILGLDVLVNTPRRNLAVVDGLDRCSVSNNIATGKDPWHRGLQHGIVGLDAPLSGDIKWRNGIGQRRKLGAVGRDDKVGTDTCDLFCA